MQQDGSNPTVFDQICNDGIIPYISANYSNDIPKELAFVMIPGDLVDNGLVYSQWANTFFKPSENLFNQVPVYPVLGNHEINTPTYFNYFHLPENGTPGYLEHWWFKDYANMRIIGLDSNTGYTIQSQLDWLQNVLDEACADTTIDFVFAQLHHPFHSELWPAGNLNYTGSVITKLENFSTQCGKPSLHFYGHTHAYSRGQSQNHVHAMVNVASAGGNIDYWNEFAQTDYPEHTVSQDDYGFVLVEVQGGASPQFKLKRISQGNVNVPLNNVLRDSFLVKKNNVSPLKPNGIFPAQNDILQSNCPLVLQANAYSDPDGDAQGATQWQIATDAAFGNIVYDQWRQYQNWWNNVDLQASDDLSDEEVGSLVPSTHYYWRVRYRDQSLGWSEWSTPIDFYTDNAPVLPNLLLNGGAENGVNNWIQDAGAFESINSGQCAGNNAYQGSKLFAVGGVCSDNAYGEGHQDVDISAYAAQIDAGNARTLFGGYVSDYNGDDKPEFRLDFLDASLAVIGNTATYGYQSGSWTLLDKKSAIPPQTRHIRFVLMGMRLSGNDNDSYFDEMYLKVDTIPCTQVVSGIEYADLIESHIRIFPNPASDEITLMYKNYTQDVPFIITDANGSPVLKGMIIGKRTKCDIHTLTTGVYYLQVQAGKSMGIKIVKE